MVNVQFATILPTAPISWDHTVSKQKNSEPLITLHLNPIKPELSQENRDEWNSCVLSK